jgi:hypothetical protein
MTAPEPLSAAGYQLMPFLRLAQLPGGVQSRTSLRDALQRAGYAQSRPFFGVADVRAVLASHPSLVDDWLLYSQDKDTPEGWYVLRDAEVGQLLKPAAQRQFASIQEAVAAFILHELDHHAGVGQDASP